jgi:hypothetical protein
MAVEVKSEPCYLWENTISAIPRLEKIKFIRRIGLRISARQFVL